MTITPPQVLFTTEGFPARPELNAFAADKAAVDKLERALATSAGARKHPHYHPRAVDLGAALPKAPHPV